jgi:hypothetical protein
MDICGGGTISVGANSINFTNDHTEACTITSCTLAGWPTTDPVIAAKQGSTPGSGTVNLSVPATAGTYTYTPNCCRKRNNPQIKVQ